MPTRPTKGSGAEDMGAERGQPSVSQFASDQVIQLYGKQSDFVCDAGLRRR
jgi:hypothetical protein